MDPRRALPAISVTLAVTYLTGCGPGPYALSISDYNDSGTQRPAVIQIGDPQVFARESLINDRRSEADLIKKFLVQADLEFAKSEFKPEIRRQLESVRAIAAQLSVAVDPLMGSAVERSEALGELDQELEVLKRQIEIERRSQDLADLKSGVHQPTDQVSKSDTPSSLSQGTESESDSQPVASSTAQESPNPDPETTTDPSTEGTSNAGTELTVLLPALEELQEEVAELRSNLQSRLTGLSISSDGSEGGTPLERFNDLQAYRTTLRSALSEVSLDDLHDYRGNALYRLQFQASVMPGEDKDKFGVARLTVLDPHVDLDAGPTIDEFSDVYAAWISHVTKRLNEHLDPETSTSPIESLHQLSSGAGLFDIFSLRSRMENKKVRIAIPPSLSAKLRGPWAEFRAYFEELDTNNRAESRETTSSNKQNPTQPHGSTDECKSTTSFDKEYKTVKDNLEKSIEGVFAKYDYEAAPQCKGAFHLHAEIIEKAIDLANENNQEISFQLEREKTRFQNKCKRFILIEDKNRDGIEDENKNKIEFYGKYYDVDYVFRTARYYIRLASGLSVALVSLDEHRKYLHESDLEEFEEITKPIFRIASISRTFIEIVKRINNKERINERYGKCGDFGVRTYVADGREPPLVFNEYLAEAVERSRTYAYSTTPVVESQRISTTAKAAQSLELAVAAAANLRRYGVKGEGAVGALRTSAAAIDATERAPLVVGFSDRQAEGDWQRFRQHGARPEIRCRDGKQCPQFGWIFGPKLRLNPEQNRLELVQVPSAHKLFADISLPAWWPSVRLRLDTAWIGSNWHGKGQIVDLIRPGMFHSETFRVALPLNSSDLDALTSYLASRTTSQFVNDIEIANVQPTSVGACGEDVSFLIRGANVWRSSEVYLSGVEGRIKVLPDMEGVLATFKSKELFGTRSTFFGDMVQSTELTLWTRNGEDSIEASLIGRLANGACTASIEISAGKSAQSRFSERPSISSVSPGVISACEDEPMITVSGHRLITDQSGRFIEKAKINVLVGNVKADKTDIDFISRGFDGTSNNDQMDVFSVKFDKPFDKTKSDSEVALTIANQHGIATVPIRPEACSTKSAKRSPIVVTPEALVIVADKPAGKNELRTGGLDLLVPDGKIPANVGDIRVGLLFPEILPDTWFESKDHVTNVLIGDGANRRLSGIIEIKSDLFSRDWVKLDKAQKLKVALFLRGKADDRPDIVRAKGTAFYYPDTASAKLSFTTKKLEKIVGEEVAFEYPAFWETVFPGLNNVDFESKIEELDLPLKVNVTSFPNAATAGERAKGSLEMGFIKPEDAQKVELDTEYKISITVMPKSRAGLPDEIDERVEVLLKMPKS